MDEQDKEKRKGFLQNLIEKGVSEAWKCAPITLKIKILGGLLVALFAFIIIIAFISYKPFNFLKFSNNTSGNYDKNFEEFWYKPCEDDNCTKEEKERYEKLKASQDKFYKRLDSLINKNDLKEEQKYIILTTLFFDLDIDEFYEGESGAYNLLSDDEFSPEINEKDYSFSDVYKEEYDSLRELVKQFKTYTAVCYPSTYKNENGEDVTPQSYNLKDSQNKDFSYSFLDYVRYNLSSSFPTDQEFLFASSTCSGQVSFEKSISNDKFYEYLMTTDYLDKRKNYKSYFTRYAENNDLDIEDIKEWNIEDKKNVRNNIIELIKDIVKEFMDDQVTYMVAPNNMVYWWPIGSRETTEKDGVLFATGDPETVKINSNFGMRYHPILHENRLHDGIDIGGCTLGETNVIASMSGEVIAISNNCHSTNSDGCNSGAGNFVNIKDTKGNVTSYRHLYQNSITVEVGDQVSQGQVIAKVGSSGTSSAKHLHFTIKINGTAVDPLEYVDPENPRPASTILIDFNHTSYTKNEFIAKMEQFYSKDGVCNGFRDGDCYSYQNQVLNNGGASIIYDISTKSNINPEIYASRVIVEGYSPGSNYNYVGYRCYNTNTSACQSFANFSAAVQTFVNNAAGYSSAEDMFARYAYLGDYWYTGIHWGLGGCAYAKYIYPDGIPDRVVRACDHADGYCSAAGEAVCEKTTDEDKQAYKNYQLRKMVTAINMIFY